jgi:NADH:ubiquinone oxidoreductase subunit C
MLDAAEIRSTLTVAGIAALSIEQEGRLETVIRVTPDQRDEVIAYLRDGSLAFTQLLDLFGADIEARDAVEADADKGVEAVAARAGYIEVTYLMRSMSFDTDLWIKMQLPYESDYHSCIRLFASAYLTERELCEMFGLTLNDHPNPKRLVTNPHFPTPLLKSVPIRGKEDVWHRG